MLPGNLQTRRCLFDGLGSILNLLTPVQPLQSKAILWMFSQVLLKHLQLKNKPNECILGLPWAQDMVLTHHDLPACSLLDSFQPRRPLQ